MKYSSEENYLQNLVKFENMKFIKYSPYSLEGYIEIQAYLYKIKFANVTTDKYGCGWVAVWNLLKAMGLEYSKCAIIQGVEKGAILGGILGTSVAFIAKYLNRSGHHTQVLRRLPADAKYGILYSWHWLGAHFVAFEDTGVTNSSGDKLYRFHNSGISSSYVYDSGDKLLHYVPVIMTMKEYFKASKSFSVLQHFIVVEP